MFNEEVTKRKIDKNGNSDQKRNKTKTGKHKNLLRVLFFSLAVIVSLSAAIMISCAQGQRLDAPTIERIYNTAECISLKWTRVKNATGYIVYRNRGNGWKEYAKTKGQESVKLTDEKVRTMKTYSYKVRAVKGSLMGSLSNKAEYKFIGPTYIKSVKTVDGGLKVSWETRSKGGYEVYRRPTDSEKWKKVTTINKSSTGSYTDKSVKSGESYTYTVRRVSGESLSAYQNKKNSKNTTKYIGVTKKIKAKNSPKGIKVSWKKVDGAKKYIVYRKTQNGEWKQIESVKSANTSYIDKKFKSAKRYYYCVRAVSGKYQGKASKSCSLWAVNPNKKMIALTYDDGPYTVVTDHILSVLKKYNSRATFFVVGSRLDAYKSSLKKETKLGCQVGVHTYNHATLTGLSPERIKSEVNSTVNKIKSYTGVSPCLVRAPGGAVNDKVKENAGYPLINWSIDTLDWKYRNTDSVISHVKTYARDGAIVLMHDLYQTTGRAADTIIPWLVKNGYQLVTVSEMMDAKGITLSSKGLYCNAYSS